MYGGRADSDASATGVTYTLLIDLAEPASVEFGAAGRRELRAGRYAYTGSALGPDGFDRVDRNHRLAAGEYDARHWHVDSLLGHPGARLAGDVRSSGLDAECEIARAIVDAAATGPSPASARPTATAGTTWRSRADAAP